MDFEAELEYVRSLTNNEARAAAAGALWLRTFGDDDPLPTGPDALWVEQLVEEAYDDPLTRRMTLAMLRLTRGWNRRELAKILHVSIVDYNWVELGHRPLSVEGLKKIVAAKAMPQRRFEAFLLLSHAMMLQLDPVGDDGRPGAPGQESAGP